jgi:hypothetical protein
MIEQYATLHLQNLSIAMALNRHLIAMMAEAFDYRCIATGWLNAEFLSGVVR